MLLLNTDPGEPFEVEVGDRIAQLVIVRSEPAEVEEVDSLGRDRARGSGLRLDRGARPDRS